MNTIILLAIIGTFGLVLLSMQVVYGQEDNTKQYNLCLDTFKETYPNLDNDKETKELICGALWGEDGIRDKEYTDYIKQQELRDSIRVLEAKQQGFESILNYCFQHADRPNPLQDLIDKGLMSSNMTGITCKDVKQTSDINAGQIVDLYNELE